MKISTTNLEGVLILELQTHCDDRGVFTELHVQKKYEELNISQPFVQDNWSISKKGVLRGLHCQLNHPQGKLVTVLQGHILDVVADINPTSPTFGKYVAVELFGQNEKAGKTVNIKQLWVPGGYVHGFCVLSEQASLVYKCTEIYHPEDETGVIWNDADLAIQWPIKNPILSVRDLNLPTLEKLTAHLAQKVS